MPDYYNNISTAASPGLRPVDGRCARQLDVYEVRLRGRRAWRGRCCAARQRRGQRSEQVLDVDARLCGRFEEQDALFPRLAFAVLRANLPAIIHRYALVTRQWKALFRVWLKLL